MARRHVWILGLVMLIVIGGARPADADERVVINFQSPVEVPEFLTVLQNTLDLPLVWDPKSRGIQGKTMTGELRFEGTRAEILDALRGVLAFRELVMIPVGEGDNARLLVMDARQTAAIVKLKPVYVEITDENVDALAEKDGLFVTTTIRVEHMAVLRDARNALNRIVTGQNIGNVTEVPDARAFVVTDFAPNVASIYRLLRSMDVPASRAGVEAANREVVFQVFRLLTGQDAYTRQSGRSTTARLEAVRKPPRPLAAAAPDLREEIPELNRAGVEAANREVVFQVFRLKHAPAVQATQTLVAHFGTTSTSPTSRPGAVQRGQQMSGQVPEAPRLRIHADARLNQVLVTGMRKDVSAVAEVVKTLDQPLPRVEASVQYIRLEHANAVYASSILTSIIGGSPALWTEGPRGTVRPAVIADQPGNALLVHAGEPTLPTLRRLIAELDTPKPETEESGDK